MRIALVTSQVNYVRDNYSFLLNQVLEARRDQVVALIVIQNRSGSLLTKALGLMFMGVRRLGWILIKNYFLTFFRESYPRFREWGVPLFETKSINSPEALRFLSSLNLDLIVNARTRSIFRRQVLQIPRWGCINIHHGLLPEYRGTSCDLWALYEGRPLGFTIHRMNEKIDDGEILLRKSFHIDTKDYSQIPMLSSRYEVSALLECLEQIEQGTLRLIPNRSDQAIYSRSPSWTEIRKMKRAGVRL